MLREMFRFGHRSDMDVECPRIVCRLHREQVAKNGVMSYVTSFKEFDVSEQNKGIHYLDFSLTNLIAIGATDKMQVVGTMTVNDMQVIDDIAKNVVEPVKKLNYEYQTKA